MKKIIYLWEHRARYPVGDSKFVKAWVKRLFTFPELLKRNYQRYKLTSQGACIHVLAELSAVRADGNKRNLVIGAKTFVGNVELALHDEIIIGENVCINDGVKILTASHDVLDIKWRHKKAKITIEDFVWISTNVIILPGIIIGRGAVVGAGAVVTKNVLPGQIVAGNPATPTNKTRPVNLDYNPCEFLAANQAWMKG